MADRITAEVAVLYTEALAFLLSFADLERTGGIGRAGDAFDLGRMRDLLARLQNPERGRRTVHIAGSKGKGSVATMTEAILRAQGLRTGLFTSPHLHSYCERIALDGAPISEEWFADGVARLRPLAEAMIVAGRPPTTFELLTALAFLVFRDEAVDVQVVEVGLGGRLDTTNVLDEKNVCVIMPIGLEHTDILGPDLRSIAREKAGIARAGIPVVMALQPAPAAETIREVCAAIGAPLHEVGQECAARRVRGGEEQEFRSRTPQATYTVTLPLAGAHQMENAIVAIRCVELFLERTGGALSPDTVSRALAEVRIPGRLEALAHRPRVIFDAAHTVESARRIVEALRDDLGVRTAAIVIGVSADKDMAGVARAFAPLSTVVIATRSGHPRAADPVALAAAFRAEGCEARVDEAPASAFDTACALAGESRVVLVTGSFYLVGELRALLLGLAPRLPNPA